MLPSSPTRHRPWRRSFSYVAVALILPLVGLVHAAGFELAFCAPVGAWPMSDRERPGFDNAIAEILADELGATATFTWTNFDAVGIRDTLHAGVCDVAIGIGEGVAGTLSTVPYLKTPYVFVTRTDRHLVVDSLDDPQLTTLAIGTYQAGIPSIALRNRGIEANVREYAALVRPTGQDDHTPILDAVLAGEIDVGIVYGPAAAGRALDEAGVFALRPVTPELDLGATILQLSRIWTIGVRGHDEALRDRLNRALANRWDDVTAAMEAYGIPQLPISRPVDVEGDPDATRVGVIFPASTPKSLANGPVGDLARLGALVAENAVALHADPDAPFVLLDAHAPTLAAVERAAKRLILVEEVDAIVGGYDRAEATLLARLAADHDVAFFNVGSEDDALRDPRCYPTTLHVAPSGRMLLTGIVAALPTGIEPRVFAVAERGTETEGLAEALAVRVAEVGGELVGSALVEPGQFIFFPVFEAIRASDGAVVVLLMGPDAQELFMGQAASVGLDVAIAGLSTVRGQSRPYVQRYLQVAPDAGAAPRVVAWDPAVPAVVNEAFAARTAEPMEPAAWTTYAAIVSAFAAVQAGALHDTAALYAYLTDPATTLDVGKDERVRFRASDGQLLQELYVMEPVPGATWGRTPAARTAIARVVDVLPIAATAAASGGATEGCGAP